MRRLLLFAALWPVTAFTQPDTPPTQRHLANHYDLAVELTPETGDLNVTGTLDLVADAPMDAISFWLNGGVTVTEWAGPKVSDWDATRDVEIRGTTLAQTQQVKVRFDPALARGDTARLAFAYHGRITNSTIEIGRSLMSPAWTELSIGALWYPFSLQETLVTSRIIVMVPPKYDLAGTGRLGHIAPGQWILNSPNPVPARITLALSDRWHTATRSFANGAQQIKIYSARPSPRIELAMETVANAYAALETHFGSLPETGQTLRVLYPNDVPDLIYPGEAYATGNFVALSDAENEIGWLETLHHEVAHMWWSAGTPGTPDEFLSESLAEYSALVLGEAAFGADWLTQRLQTLSDRADEVSMSLLDLDGFPPERQRLLYSHGPIALWTLREQIGAEAVTSLLRETHATRIDTLDDFLRLLAERAGVAAADSLRARL